MWLVFALLAALLWGFNYALAERILKDISVFTLLAMEMALGAVVFTILACFTSLKDDVHIMYTKPALGWIILAEVIVVTLASYFIVLSIRAKNATAAGIVELIYPLFTIFFTWLLFRENHVNSSVIIGGTFIFIGVLVLGR
ncbi:EamA family transporter [Legionella spiritensis]|uniref:Transport protein n=1 Tax=Legionella spiritensis TaxID=452 RepID=A0A0W0Z6A9_LEGSP|nr:EamA family transporter [Legionella spiritensis]KTD64653.1 transport protein [Legionella spiritensis]SNV47607.1 transport protein [Legionella spiritensis]VEG91333.1 transport protein [Legionella spiritensis]